MGSRTSRKRSRPTPRLPSWTRSRMRVTRRSRSARSCRRNGSPSSPTPRKYSPAFGARIPRSTRRWCRTRGGSSARWARRSGRSPCSRPPPRPSIARTSTPRSRNRSSGSDRSWTERVAKKFRFGGTCRPRSGVPMRGRSRPMRFLGWCGSSWISGSTRSRSATPSARLSPRRCTPCSISCSITSTRTGLRCISTTRTARRSRTSLLPTNEGSPCSIPRPAVWADVLSHRGRRVTSPPRI